MGVVVFEIGELFASVILSLAYVVLCVFVMKGIFGLIYTLEADRRVDRIRKDHKDFEYSE